MLTPVFWECIEQVGLATAVLFTELSFVHGMLLVVFPGSAKEADRKELLHGGWLNKLVFPFRQIIRNFFFVLDLVFKPIAWLIFNFTALPSIALHTLTETDDTHRAG
jgi:hypothetical protein